MTTLEARTLEASISTVAALAGLPPCERVRAAASIAACSMPAIQDLILDQARERSPEASSWALAALDVVADPGRRALAHALLGNAERRQGRLVSADAAFRAAAAALPTVVDPVTRAQILDLLASWQSYLGDFGAAAASIAQALRLTPVDCEHLIRYRVSAAIIEGRSGEPEGAILHLRDILLDLDGGRDPWMALVCGHNLASFLCLAGEHDLARRALLTVRPLYRRVGGECYELMAEWITARIALDLGAYQEADCRLASVAAGLHVPDPINGGLLALERAQAKLGMGEWGGAAELAGQAGLIFGALGIRVEAAAAAITAAEAVAAGQISALAAVIAARRRLGA